ncbi:MAG: efflux transporter outer membrane subunit [Chitinophagaceae bacterium]|nr:MAG: efflux transporter outer membrane subunit [Chitinophagaceae bacterium]
MSMLSACSITKPVIPDSVKPPAGYVLTDSTLSRGADTGNIATISWQQFFSDQKLNGLIELAINHNPDLLMTIQRIEKANAMLMARKGAFFPRVDGVAAAGVEKYGDYTLNGVGNFDTNLSPNLGKDQRIPNPTPEFLLGLRSSWEIDLWGELKNRKKAAHARYLKEQHSARFLETLLVSEVAKRYYDLTSLDNERSIIQKNIALQETALEIVKVQKEAGRATELAVQQFNAQLLFTRAAAYRVKQETVSVEMELNNLLGRFPAAVSRDSLRPLTAASQQFGAGLPSQLLLRRPDIRAAEMELVAAKADVTAARAAFYPSLTINPFVGLNAFSASMLFSGASLAYGVAGGLTAPIFNQRKIKAAYKISIAENREAYQDYRKKVINAYSEVITHLNAIGNLTKAFNFKEQEVAALQNAVGTSRDLYLGGRASYLEIISAQKVLLEAEIELNHIQREQYQNRIALYRSLGGGWN